MAVRKDAKKGRKPLTGSGRNRSDQLGTLGSYGVPGGSAVDGAGMARGSAGVTVDGERLDSVLQPIKQDLAPASEVDVLQQLTPQQVALFAAMLINGGNTSEAARTVGMNASYARRIVSRHAVFREAIRQYGRGMKTCLQDWMELVPRAKQEMLNLLNDGDGKTRYLAAKDILDRAEGKPIGRMDLTVQDDRNVLTEGEIQLVMSLMRSRGITYAESVNLVKANPEDAQQWIALHAVRRSETVVAEVVSSEPSEPEPELPEPADQWGKDVGRSAVPSRSKAGKGRTRMPVKRRTGSRATKD